MLAADGGAAPPDATLAGGEIDGTAACLVGAAARRPDAASGVGCRRVGGADFTPSLLAAV